MKNKYQRWRKNISITMFLQVCNADSDSVKKYAEENKELMGKLWFGGLLRRVVEPENGI
jgi:hypothetical protein